MEESIEREKTTSSNDGLLDPQKIVSRWTRAFMTAIVFGLILLFQNVNVSSANGWLYGTRIPGLIG